MKAALLGLAHPHSGILLTTLENLPEITSVCLWDADPAVAAHPNLPFSRKVVQTTSDLDSVLGQADLVFAIVCVRHDRAAEISGRVVAAGKHLVAEKPVGFTSTEIEELQQAVARSGVVASVLYVRRFHPCIAAARQFAEAGALGPLISAEARFLTTQVKFRQPESWLFRRSQAGGGILLWLGCHCLDLMHYVTRDEITDVGARFAIRSGESIDVEDTAVLSFRFRSGALGSLHVGYALVSGGEGYLSPGYDSYLGFNGRDGRIFWPDLNPRLCLESRALGTPSLFHEESYPMPPSTSYGGTGGETFFRLFIAAMQGNGGPPTTLVDALRTARIIEAAEQSASHGRFIRVESPSENKNAGSD